jgi:hypothetical protein
MTKKIFYTILGAVVLLVLVALLWFWFFHRTSTPAVDNGSLGSAQNRGNIGTGNTGVGGNGQAPIGSSAGTGAGTSGSNTQIPISYSTDTGGNTSAPESTYVPLVTSGSDVTWLDGSISGSGSKSFNPTAINALNQVDISGTGTFNSGGGGNSNDSGLGAGAIACTAGLLTGAANIAISSALGSLLAVTVNAPLQNAKDADTLMKDFYSCIARTIARAILQKITANVVDWINSGFNGQPGYVQDFKQLFVQAADQAAGQFLQGSDFAFLCSPFQQQVKIAVAQSYAHRTASASSGGTGSGGNSCTLTQAVGNVDKFINGDFSQGGWNGLLAFTTTPTNNPYGAYMYEQQALNSAQQQAVQTARDELLYSGYKPVKNDRGEIIIPAATVAGITQKSLDTPIDELNMAKNFDEILSLLITQLVDRTIYNGLSNLSGFGGYANNFSNSQNQQASAVAQTLLTQLQSAVQTAQQYGVAQQGSISDLQNAQGQLVVLDSCWSTVASSTTLTAGQTVQAGNNAISAEASIQNLETRIALYNANITHANSAIVKVQELQTAALAATTLAQVQAVSTQFSAAQSSGVLITQTDVVSAQQDRTTLQNEMNALNQTTATQLNQCYAFGQ